MENARIANMLAEIADLLDLKGANEYRIRAYQSASQSIRDLSERVEDLAEEDKDLSELPSIGKGMAEKITEILERGTCSRLEELKNEIPEGLTTLMDIPGLGPRKVEQLNQELDIESLEDLKKAAKGHEIRKLDGMGAKTEEKILEGIATVKETAGRLLHSEAREYLRSLKGHLDRLDGIDEWEVAGSLRRGKETIGDLDVLIRAKNREAAGDQILAYDNIDRVISQGKERISVRLEGGFQVDFRFFDPEAFGSALLYFTGSKAHNIALRKIAQKRDWKLNEYGLFKGDHRLAGHDEAGIYKRLNLKWIPPELREDRGEVDAARSGDLPTLIERSDIRGDFQCHTTASDGQHTIKKMATSAKEYGFDYLAITDHSKRVTMAEGLDDDATRKHADRIRKVNDSLERFWLLAGIEVDILKSGKLDLKEKTLAGLDWVVASIHYDRNMSKKAMTDRIVTAIRSGVVHCLGHPLGRIIGKREPLEVDLDEVFQACLDHDVRIEINAQPDRLDLPDVHCKRARDAGVGFTLGTDAHSADSFHFIDSGVLAARRGWLRKKDVLNTVTITELKKRLRRR